MKPAMFSLLFAAALAVPAFAQESLPAPPQDARTQPPVQLDIPEGAFGISLPSEIKIDNGGIIIDGKRRLMVGHRGPLSTQRIITVTTLSEAGTAADGEAEEFEVVVVVPKNDSAAMVIDGKRRLFVGWRARMSLLRTSPAAELPSAREEATTPAATDVAQGPTISEEARSFRPDPPLTIDAIGAANAGYSLASPAPNPVLESATIDFTLPRSGVTNLTVFDATGHAVSTLVNDDLAAGRHSVRFDASGLVAGRYLYRLTSGTFAETKTMTVVK